MRLIKAILCSLPAIFCWQFAPTDAGVEPQMGRSERPVLTMCKVTAYCPCEKCCGRYADGITASGHKIRPGDRFAAADPNIPFGTMLIIQGYNNNKPVPVLDRGGAIKGAKLDVFFDTHKEALEWGVKYLKVEITNED